MSTERILAFPDALAEVLAHAAALSPPHTERVPLAEAHNRTLAAPAVADRDQPPFDRSTRDGYALTASSLTTGQPVSLIGTVRAGQAWQGPALQPYEAVEIMTGAPVPTGADAVLMLEHALITAGQLHLAPARSLAAGANIVSRAAEARAGQTVLPRGRLLGPAELAVLASIGAAHLDVFARPSVAILSTGDELVEVSDPVPLSSHQIRNSNAYALAALVAAEHATPHRLPIARDTRADLDARLTAALTGDFDLLLLSGGVSAGKFDLVEPALAALGAEFLFTGTLIQPGKPLVFGRLPRPTHNDLSSFRIAGGSASPAPPPRSPWLYFFGLPGNPISTQVCFHLFVAPLLRALSGRADLAPRFATATLTEPIPPNPHLTRFLPAELTADWHATSIRLTRWQGSGDVTANALANAYCVLPPTTEAFTPGTPMQVLLR